MVRNQALGSQKVIGLGRPDSGNGLKSQAKGTGLEGKSSELQLGQLHKKGGKRGTGLQQGD